MGNDVVWMRVTQNRSECKALGKPLSSSRREQIQIKMWNYY